MVNTFRFIGQKADGGCQRLGVGMESYCLMRSECQLGKTKKALWVDGDGSTEQEWS